MNRFTADYSSSPTSTPPRNGGGFFNPPEVASTTPIAPPPSTAFGSSRLGTGQTKPLFQKASPTSSRAAPASQGRSFFHANEPSARPRSRLFQTEYNTSTGSGSDKDPVGDYDEQDAFGQDAYRGQSPAQPANNKSLMRFSTNSPQVSFRRSINRRRERNASELPGQGQPNLIPGIARDLASRTKSAEFQDDDEIVLETEFLMEQLSDDLRDPESDPADVVDSKAQQLITFWQSHSIFDPNEGADSSVGPSSSAPAFDKANYIASLLLQIHHPQSRGSPTSLPRALLDWLETRHVSYNPLLRSVTSNPTNVTASELFWDAVLALTLRGRLGDVMKLLAEADFRYAATSVDDGADAPGYKGSQLQTIQDAVYRARQVLNASPPLAGNWDTSGPEWSLYRDNLETELDILSQMVSEPIDDQDNSDLLGGRSQNARSLPLSVYQALHTMFNILLGSTDDIINQAQDWLEAACALTVWWDGQGADQAIALWSEDVTRATNQATPLDRSKDLYLRRLRDSFLSVTDPGAKESFSINTFSLVEVGVGCVLQSSVQGAISVIRTQSLCLAAAVTEIGSAANWLNQGVSSLNGFDAADLMVLSYAPGRDELTKDDILQQYAISLFGRDGMRNADGGFTEGWELSLGVLRRMSDQQLMHEYIDDLLSQLDVTDSNRAEQVIDLCDNLGLPEEARKTSERYGDHLVNSTTDYGMALLVYARAHASHKIQQLTDMLVSYCLVQSRAYPAEKDMDNGLRRLVDSPKTAFADIASSDPEAAAHLQFYMVGYACIRRFYTLRDSDVSANTKDSRLQPGARTRAAAKALVAATNSAADSIYGGLYDASRQSAIQVDGLLTLLGEATALLSKTQTGHTEESGVFTSEQLYALLAAIEDLETVSDRVYAATEECMRAAINNFAGEVPPSPRDMLKKSMSSGTNSNFSFSMMGSEMLARSGESGGGKSVGSAVLVRPDKGDGVHRGWDWRSRFVGKEVEGLGRAVLRELRRAVAQELSLKDLEG
jgi:hypothetical protein